METDKRADTLRNSELTGWAIVQLSLRPSTLSTLIREYECCFQLKVNRFIRNLARPSCAKFGFTAMLCIQLRSWAWNMKHDFTWFYEALGLPFECWTCWPGWFQRPSDEFWDWQCTKKTGVFTSEELAWNDFKSWLLRCGSYCAACIGNVHRSIHYPETSYSGADSNSKNMHYRSPLFIFSYYILWLSFRTWPQLSILPVAETWVLIICTWVRVRA